MTSLVLPFAAGKDATAADLETLGGKAQSLSKMTAAGFPVPPGFTVTTAAYRQFVADNNLQQTIVELAKPEIADQRASFDGAAERIQALFARFEPTDELKAQIADAYVGLGAGHPAAGHPRRGGPSRAQRTRSGALLGECGRPAGPVLRRPAGHLSQCVRPRRSDCGRAQLLGITVDGTGHRVPARECDRA